MSAQPAPTRAGHAWLSGPLGLALLAALLMSCAPGQVLREGRLVDYEEAARLDLEAARIAHDAGNLETAQRILERFRAELAYSRQIDEALLLLGEVYERQQRRELAAQTWRELVVAHPRSPSSPRAALRASWIYRDLGQPELGLELLSRSSWETAPADLRARIHRLRADLARETGDWAGAVLGLAHARRDVDDAEMQLEIDVELEELIERIEEAELAGLARRLPSGAVSDRVHLVLARRALVRSDYAAAQRALDRLPPRLRPRDELERQRLDARARRGSERVGELIGVALPLSGPYADFGQRALRAIVLGLGLYDETGGGRLRVLVRDTAGEVDRGKRAVEDLITDGASAILGPLRSAVAAAAAPVAEVGGVPILTMARRQDLPYLGDFVFRVGLSPEDEVRALVAHFSAERGFGRFAVLYPDDDYGREFKNAFWDAIETFGGEMVGVERYAPDVVDWQEPIRKLIGLHYLTPEQRERLDERETLLRYPVRNEERLAEEDMQGLPPFVDFEALFIPDAGARVGLILPQLRFFDVQEAIFAGTSEWNSPELVEIAGRQASGALFTSAFDVTSDRPAVRAFVERHRTTYGVEPDLISALARDAAVLLRRHVESGTGMSREQLRRSILDTRDFDGVSGLTGFDASGDSQHLVQLLTVSRGRIHPIGGGR